MNAKQIEITEAHLAGTCTTDSSCTCSTDIVAADAPALSADDFNGMWEACKEAGFHIRDLGDKNEMWMGFRTINAGLGEDAEAIATLLADRGLLVWQVIRGIIRIAR